MAVVSKQSAVSPYSRVIATRVKQFRASAVNHRSSLEDITDVTDNELLAEYVSTPIVVRRAQALPSSPLRCAKMASTDLMYMIVKVFLLEVSSTITVVGNDDGDGAPRRRGRAPRDRRL